METGLKPASPLLPQPRILGAPRGFQPLLWWWDGSGPCTPIRAVGSLGPWRGRGEGSPCFVPGEVTEDQSITQARAEVGLGLGWGSQFLASSPGFSLTPPFSWRTRLPANAPGVAGIDALPLTG